MKRDAAFMHAPVHIYNLRHNFSRGHLYLLTRKVKNISPPAEHPQLVLLTHFYKTGLRLKPLSKKHIEEEIDKFFGQELKSISKPFTLTWEKFDSYNITPVTEEEVSLHLNDSTKYLNEYLEGRNDYDREELKLLKKHKAELKAYKLLRKQKVNAPKSKGQPNATTDGVVV